MNNWQSWVDHMINYAMVRPAFQRQHLREYFDIDSDVNITLDLNDSSMGRIGINTISIDPSTPGIPENPYPWTGIYFKGIPITVRAEAAPGYTFSHWEGDVRSYSSEPQITPTGDLYLKAHFVPSDIPQSEIVHYWHFNTLSGTVNSVASDYSANSTGIITYPGEGAGYLDERTHRAADPVSNLNLQMGIEPDQGAVLRVRNPSDTRVLLIEAPSLGFKDITGAFAVARTSNGATEQELYYSVDAGASWQQIGQTYSVPEIPAWDLITFDISTDEDADNNPDLMLKIVYLGDNAANDSGNTRIDNLSFHGIPLPMENYPPTVIHTPALQKCIEGDEAISFELSELFEDPENDPLSFTVNSSHPELVEAIIQAGQLQIMPIQRGDSQITLSANDGVNENDVSLQFRVLVYPQAHDLRQGGFAFKRWAEDTPELIYPENMIFLQSDTDDPVLGYPLEYAYHIEHDDYHADDADKIGFPYMLTGRSRLNGLDDDGIAFINTGRGRDLGGALLALNTMGQDELKLNWLGGTLAQNTREYAIRLQYRIGINSEFSDLMHNGECVEYMRNTVGHTQLFENIVLPNELLNQEYVQLLWKHYLVSGSKSSRDQLRLDDIIIGDTYDFPNNESVAVGNIENPITFTVSGGNANHVEGYEIPPFNNGLYNASYSTVLEFFGHGPWTLIIEGDSPWAAFYQNTSWHAAEAKEGIIRLNISAAKGGGLIIPITVGDKDPTLPVALSSFTATLTTDNNVKIEWIAESETDHAGYNILRGLNEDLSTSVQINHGLIQDGTANGSQIAYQYTDAEVYLDNTYYYWLLSVGLNGSTDFHGPLMVIVETGEDPYSPQIPLETKLYSAYPNPFNPSTTLRYGIKEAGEVSIQIFNLKGQIIKNFEQGYQDPGFYQIIWDGCDASGRMMSSGIYLYRMQTKDYSSIKKMIISK